LNAIQQVLEKSWRNVLTANPWQRAMPSDSVKAAGDAFLNSGSLDWVGCGCKLFREKSQLARAKTVSVALQGREFRSLARKDALDGAEPRLEPECFGSASGTRMRT
jgi:hypothetical protein